MNKVIIIGNLTRDPELTQTNNGIARCTFGVAVNRSYTNAQGEREVDFLNIVTWRGLAENCHKYLKKGSKVGVSGSIQIRSYEVEGQKRSATDIVAEDVEFLNTRSDGESSYSGNSGGGTESKKKVAELTPVEDDSLPF